MEVICKLFELKKFINRGFLIGPICPIYGYGVLSIILLIGFNIKPNANDIIIPTDQCISQHSSENLLFAVDGDYHKESQVANV